MRFLFFTSFVLFYSLITVAQQSHCYTNEYLSEMVQSDPQLLEKINSLRLQNHDATGFRGTDDDVYVIPIVVHIVYHKEEENIDENRVLTQLNVLNEDYRRLNEDASETPAPFAEAAADCRIQFCLASIDPEGDSTTGITRTFTENINFSAGSEIKSSETGGVDNWDPDSYLNIWVCNLPNTILGYSSLPGFPENEDGVVINYRYFGMGAGAILPYNLGRTCTHEIGHYLGLRHVWGDDGGSCAPNDDGFDDTPSQGSENYGCPAFPLLDSCSPESPGVMFMNYMDYSDDGCMNMFTNDQVAYMRTTIETVRASLLLSPAGCNDIVPLPGEIAELVVNPNPADNIFTVTVKNFAGTVMEIQIYDLLGQRILGRQTESSHLVNEYFELPLLARGSYFVTAFNGTYILAKQFIVY